MPINEDRVKDEASVIRVTEGKKKNCEHNKVLIRN